MATPGEKLAESLEKLKELQDQGVVAIGSGRLSRVHKERLVENGFLREVIKGWYISMPQDEQDGNTTSWYISFWQFCGQYLHDRFGDDHCLSPEQSLALHAGNRSVPKQLLIRSSKGNNTSTDLLFGTSLFPLNSPLPSKVSIQESNGIRMMDLASAIVYSNPSIYITSPTDVRTALSLIRNASELLPILLDGGHTTIAGRLVGAYRNLGRDRIADDIFKAMKSAGYDVRESDPFAEPTSVQLDFRERSPYVNRIRLMWEQMRVEVINVFPEPPGLAQDKAAYLKQIEEHLTTDAYHSLSIERYTVTPALIEKIRSGAWDADANEADRKQKDAMAARGYLEAFKAVKLSIEKILDGANAGKTVDLDHGEWYLKMFTPSVTAGIVKASDLAGYRNAQVYIASSKHTPINRDGVRDVMPVLFELLEKEEHAGVRAVLGHFIFVYTHPYMDGNGRMGRFLMNAMLASGGYPWTVIPVEERERYMSALESASVEQDIRPFAAFIVWLVEAGMQGKPIARID